MTFTPVLRNVFVTRDWSRGGNGFPIPDSKHPAAKVVLEQMQNEINQITGGLGITSPAATDLPSTLTLVNEIRTKLLALNAFNTAPLVVFEPTPITAQW